MIYWFIGQPGCGKTSLAKALRNWYLNLGFHMVRFDGDDLRKIFKDDYKPETFTPEYLNNTTRTLQRMVKYINDQGISVIVSTVNSNREVREEFKKKCKGQLVEIHVINSGNHVREKFHRKDFEPPMENFIHVDTNGKTPIECIQEIKRELLKNFVPRLKKDIKL